MPIHEIQLTHKVPGPYHVIFSHNGKYVATFTKEPLDGKHQEVYLWNRSTGELLKQFSEPCNRITCFAFSSDDQRIAYANNLGQIVIWDSSTNEKIQLKAHSSVVALTFAENKEFIIYGTNNNSIIKQNIHTKTINLSIKCNNASPLTGLKLSPYEKYLIATYTNHTLNIYNTSSGEAILYGSYQKYAYFFNDSLILSTYGHNTINLLSCLNMESIFSLNIKVDNITSLHHFKDGFFACYIDGTIQWYSLLNVNCSQQIFNTHTHIADLYPLNDSTVIVGCSDGKLITLENIPEQLTSYSAHDINLFPDNTPLSLNQKIEARRLGHCHAPSFYRSEPALYSTIYYNNNLHSKMNHFFCKPEKSFHTGLFIETALSWDNKLLATVSNDSTLRIWDTSTGKCLRIITLNKGKNTVNYITILAFSPDEKSIIMYSNDKKIIQVFDIATGMCRFLLQHQRLAKITNFSFEQENPNIIALVNSNTREEEVWNIATQTKLPLYTFNNLQQTPPPSNFKISDEIEYDGTTISILDTDTNNQISRFIIQKSPWRKPFTYSTKRLSGCIENKIQVYDTISHSYTYYPKVHTDHINIFAISADETTLASGSFDMTICLWDVASKTCTHRLRGHTENIHALSFSPDGTLLASGSEDGSTSLWDVSSGTCIHYLRNHTGRVIASSLSRYNTYLASGSFDNTIQLWNIKTKTLEKTLTGHTDSVTCCLFSKDERYLFSASLDHTIRIWDVESGKCLHTLQGHSSGILKLTLSPDELCLTSEDESESLYKWYQIGTFINPRYNFASPKERALIMKFVRNPKLNCSTLSEEEQKLLMEHSYFNHLVQALQ